MGEAAAKAAAGVTFRLDGQRAVVTGAGSGLGRAIAVGLAAAGADVAATELPGKEAAAAQTVRAIEALGRRGLALPLDVTDLRSIQEMAARAEAELGPVDILVNNAGINIRKPALEVMEEDWDRVLDVNLKGVFFCSQAVGRQMVARRRGAIVNVASINGVVGYYERAAYCASKAGVVNLTRVLAIEWAPYGVRVNAIGPTYIETDLTRDYLARPEVRQEILWRTPQRRTGEPHEVVGAVVFLASPAASLVTGHTLLVDGGWTAW